MQASEAEIYAYRAWPDRRRWPPLVAVVTCTSACELPVGFGSDDDLSALCGNDDLRGGASADRFVFFSGETGAKAITDFAAGDVIVLKGDGWRSVRDIIDTGQAVGTGNYVCSLVTGLTVGTTNTAQE